MNLKNLSLTITLTSILGIGAAQAHVIDMEYIGLFTMLDPAGNALQNTSSPYSTDPTWGNGLRTQISGAISVNTDIGRGSISINPFEFNSMGMLTATYFDFGSINGDPSNFLLANIDFNLGGNVFKTQIVLDDTGFLSALSLGIPTEGTIFDQTDCGVDLTCGISASNGIAQNQYPIGSALISTTSFNTVGQTGLGTTIEQLSLGTDDGIGGSPMDNGIFLGNSINYDITSITVTNVSTVPLPAAVWLFGAGFIGLISMAKRKHT